MRQHSITPEMRSRFDAIMADLRLSSHRRRPRFPRMKPWAERSERARVKLTSSLNTFQSWRRGKGELLPVDSWTAPPPTVQILGEYLALLKVRSPSWKSYSVQAMRMYLEHVGQPELAVLVCLPRPVKGARGSSTASPPPSTGSR